MNKSSTIEFLRGMKFMMRKEEMKRHDQYDRHRSVDLVSSDPSSDRYHEHMVGGTILKNDVGSRQKRRRGPTILRDDSFSLTSYSFSRQSFCVPEALPTGNNDIKNEPIDEERTELEEELPSKRHRNTYVQEGDGEDEDGDATSEEDVEGLTAVNFSSPLEKKKKVESEEKGMEENEKVEEGKRFFISSGSSRAPKLTNKLEAKLKQATRKKKA